MIKVGTSGWLYSHWRGSFYPKSIKEKNYLPYYASHFDSVEVNNTFYNLSPKKIVRSWKGSSPPDFLFSIKANRYITHMKNLLEPEKTVSNMLENIKLLEDKLGPILFQLPPQWHVDKERLEKFIKVLPSKYSFAFEFRDKSWYQNEIYDLLEKGGLAFCIHDHRDAPSPTKITSDFVYIRFHGPDGFYRSKYKTSTLNKWSRRIKNWDATDLDVYAYFNNDAHAYAIENAKTLKTLLD
ncbi:MAG: DUF72 domain-containing protein [Patescibacteria group bacterium]|nr:DUF72 domain-containing protein [Patescibacteria group bacterium]